MGSGQNAVAGPFLIAADTVGRAAFALAFVRALADGHSAIVVAFLVLEVAFLVAQGLGVRKALIADKNSRVFALSNEPAHRDATIRQAQPKL